MRGGGGDNVNYEVFVGHGGGSGRKDDHAFLLGQSSTSSSNSNSNPRWKVRLPEQLSSTPQSITVSPCGRYCVAASTSGNCYLWDLLEEDNLLCVWKAHYRAVTCCTFDEEGATLFTGGEDGVVNAWCFLDLLDEESSGRHIHPFRTWSEHHLPIACLCVLKGSGVGCARLVSCSLDRHLIIMEIGGAGVGRSNSFDGGSGARTLARMCLPSGLHCVISDSLSGRLYCAGADGSIYCVDIDSYAIRETLDGASGPTVNVSQSKQLGVEFDSILSGNHVQQQSSMAVLADQTKYVSELKGHVKAVTSLALLDPSDLASISSSSKTNPLLSSGSIDGTVRVWDLRSRSCVKVLRPWAPSSEGLSITTASSAISSPPITGIIAVLKSTVSSTNGTLSIPSVGSNTGRRSGHQLDIASIFKPLKRFVRGSSIAHGNNGTDAKIQSNDSCLMRWPRRDNNTDSFWEEPMHYLV